MGSCFARNVEAELLKLGVQVTSAVSNSEVLEIRTNLNLEFDETLAQALYNPSVGTGI